MFPGSAAGSVTEQLARLLTVHVITGSTTSRRGTVTWTAGSPSVRPRLFVAHVRAGAETAAGDTLGEVVTPDGAHAEWIRSPGQGRVMMIRHSCAVEPGAGAGHRPGGAIGKTLLSPAMIEATSSARLGDSQLRVWVVTRSPADGGRAVTHLGLPAAVIDDAADRTIRALA